MKNLSLFSSLFSSFILIGCITPKTSDSHYEGLVMSPPSLGSVWKYTASFIENNNIKNEVPLTEKITDVSIIDGKTCYRYEVHYDFVTVIEQLLRSDTSTTESPYGSYGWKYYGYDGLHMLTIDHNEDNPPDSIEEFSLTIAHNIDVGHSYLDKKGREWTVIGQENILVPAGSFDTWVYQVVFIDETQPINSYRMRYYMTNDVGMVQLEYDDYIENEWYLTRRDKLVDRK